MTVPLYNLTDTWNNGSTVFTAILMNVTDSASNASSKLLDLQVAASSKANIDKAGNLTLAAGAFFFTDVIACVPSGFQMASTVPIQWSAGGHYWNTIDLSLQRDAAAILAQRDGVNAQAARHYETFTDAANNSMLRLDACKTTAGVHRIMSEANGTGTKRPIAIDAYSKSGAPTSTELPAGTAGVFKDTGGGGVVIAYNDGGTIKTAALT